MENEYVVLFGVYEKQEFGEMTGLKIIDKSDEELSEDFKTAFQDKYYLDLDEIEDMSDSMKEKD